MGSSPRVRGKHDVHAIAKEMYGLIPARAGKTHAVGGHRILGQAHPRACGENT